MKEQLRALAGARVSVKRGEEKTSHFAQHETTGGYAESNGLTVVGTFEDLDISADKYPTFKRPDLGPWLNDPEKAASWDVIIWTKVDRAFRSTGDCVDFAKWAKTNRKIIVFADDGLKLDYLHPADALDMQAMMAELFVYLGSFFAQIELNRFVKRAKDTHAYLRPLDRWAAGSPPLGFEVVAHPSGRGKGLATEPSGKKLLWEMAGWVFDGDSFTAIAETLNDRGELTGMDRCREHPRHTRWTVSNIIESLTSLRTQGVKMHKEKPLLRPDGSFVQLAPPTFDWPTWRKLQDAVAVRRLGGKRRVHSPNPLLGVGECGTCSRTLAQQFSKNKRNNTVHRYYRCSRTPRNCNGIFMVADQVDSLLEENFISECGDLPVTRRVFVAGEDHVEELAIVEASIVVLRAEADAGLLTTEEDKALYLSRLTGLVARRDRLAALPSRKAGWVYEATGLTYAEAWRASDKIQRRKMLVDAGVKFVIKGKNDWEVKIPSDIRNRLSCG